MASHNSFDKELDLVLVEVKPCTRTLTLNRPEKLNSLSYQMISRLLSHMREYEKNPTIKCVILKGNGRAFSAGGDCAAAVRYIMAGHWSFGTAFYRKQLNLDYLIATYEKPFVSLINGIVMGGGAGLCINGRFRVVTEKAVFSMPEASLGLYPDVGASHFLSRLPGFFGEYLGLTGARLNGAEMFACGLATHFVLSLNLPLLEKALCGLDTTDNNIVLEILDGFSQKPHVKQESPYMSLNVINECFSKNTVEEILSALEHKAVNREDKWLSVAIKYMKAASPTSLKIFLKSIREGRTQDNIGQCLVREYRMTSHVLRRTISADFFEGTRAMLLDKDKKPKWEPSKLELVTDEMVNQYFTEVDDEDWEDLQLPTKSSSANTSRAKL